MEKKVRAVLNAARSITGRYPNQGPLLLERSGVLLLDDLGPSIFKHLRDGDEVEIQGNAVLLAGNVIARGEVLDGERIERRLQGCHAGLRRELAVFLANTLEYAEREKDFILTPLDLPPFRTVFRGRHALVVVRGHNYKDDLRILKPYIREMRPVLVAVDGGADALLEAGWKPDLILGDMDSVSDEALGCGAELVVHAYTDGRAPGLERLQQMGLEARIVAAPGTSEDLGLLVPHQLGAELIVAVGTHTNVIDFLEKGRKGMASTFLVRIKVGSILVDARGVSQLYQNRVRFGHVAPLVAAALIPTGIVLAFAPVARVFFRLLVMHLRLLLGL